MKKKALAIFGDMYHCSAQLKFTIGTALEEAGYQVETIIDYDIPFDNLSDYDVIVLSKYGRDDVKMLRHPEEYDDFIRWLTAEQEILMENYVKQGGKLFFHHGGFVQYDKDGVMCKLAGAHFLNHPPIGEISVKPLLKDSPLTAGIEDFTINDEEYQLIMDESKTTVFLESYSQKNGRSPQGWYHSYGKGRVIVFIPGHTWDVLNHPAVTTCLKNIVSWLDK